MISIMLPIKIYLDSSDFSDLSNIEKKPPAYKEVHDYLVRMQNDNLVRMYFSDTHIIEAAPTTPAAVAAAMQRFQTIKDICGRNSVLHPIDVVEAELTSSSETCTDITRNDGLWFPRLVNIDEMVPDVEKMFRDDVEKRGRAEKRKYLKNDKPTARWYADMREANTGAAQAVVKHLPLSAGAIRTVNKYYVGSATRHEALNAITASIGDPEVFGTWYQNDWTSATGMSNYLREIGENFKEEIYNARALFETTLAESAAAGVDKKTFLSISTETFYKVLEETAIRIASSMAKKISGNTNLAIDPWKTAPGLTCSITMAMHVARRSVASATPRVAKPSDFPDCYHAVYLPYFDIFRADAFTASVITECKLPFDTIIVDKFLQLPAKIDRLLATRASRQT